jgi:hypothetical protein
MPDRMTALVQSTNRPAIPTGSTFVSLDVPCSNLVVVPVPLKRSLPKPLRRTTRRSALITVEGYATTSFCKHREMQGLAKYHKQSDGSLFSNPTEQTNARLEFIPGSNSSEKYLLQQIPLPGRLDYRTTFTGATISPDLRFPGSA